MNKNKLYLGVVVILIVVALVVLFTGKTAGQKPAENLQATTTAPLVHVTNGIPDNMAISQELGGGKK